jgi:hypothetical protein
MFLAVLEHRNYVKFGKLLKNYTLFQGGQIEINCYLHLLFLAPTQE